MSPLLESSASIHVEATVESVFDTVSDLRRSGEWSPECLGGEWIAGTPRAVGSVFRGENARSPEVVAWAPVVRGTWFTESEVVVSEPGRAFQWAMRDGAGNRQQSVWGFALRPEGTGTRLTHHFRMDAPTEGIRKIVSGMSEDDQKRFFADWGAKVENDLKATVAQVRKIIEAA